MGTWEFITLSPYSLVHFKIPIKIIGIKIKRKEKNKKEA